MKARADRLDYRVDGREFIWLNRTKGACEEYARAARTILAAAGFPAIYVGSTVNGEGHAWDVCLVDSSWYYVDGTAAESGWYLPMDFEPYERQFNAVMEDQDESKIAMALVEVPLAWSIRTKSHNP